MTDLAAAHAGLSIDLGAGDGRYVLHRAAEHPTELVLAIDASHEAMRDASRRAGRPSRRGGLPNAVFVASGLEQLPIELHGLASLVTVHFPWGSLLRAAAGRDASGAEAMARLVAPRGTLRLLVSAAARDTSGGLPSVDPDEVVCAFEGFGMRPLVCRRATTGDVADAHSTWGKRLFSSSRERATWLVELSAPPA